MIVGQSRYICHVLAKGNELSSGESSERIFHEEIDKLVIFLSHPKHATRSIFKKNIRLIVNTIEFEKK